MIGYGIFFGDKLCSAEDIDTYAICSRKAFAEGYAKELSEELNLKYDVKKVNIEVLE